MKQGIAYLKKLNYILNSSQKGWGYVVFVLSLIGAGFEMLGVSIILPLVNVLIEPRAMWENEYVKNIAYRLNISTNEQLIVLVCGAVVLAYFLKNSYLTFLAYIRMKYSCKIQRELSVKMMKYYISRGYLYFTQKNVSELMRGIGASVASVYQVIAQILRIISEVLTVIAICIFILMTDIYLAIGILLLAIVSLFLIVTVFRRAVEKAGKDYHRFLYRVNRASYQAFEGIKEVLVMNRQKYFVREYEDAYIKQQKATIVQNFAGEIPAYTIEFVCVAGLIVLVGWRCLTSGDANTLIPQLAAFAVAAFRILPSLGRISSGINHVSFYAPAINEVYANFKEVEEKENINERLISTKFVTSFEYQIEAQNITWKYPNNEEYVLNGLNMTIKKGQAVAIVGHSGAGKTTIADILLGLLQPEKGDIYVDNLPMFKNKLIWGKMVGFVSQTFYLNDDTIRNNIAFGINEKDIDDIMVWQALEQAQLKQMIEDLPKGIDTLVGERGIRFSGGQRQRLAIARALYFNPEILVLDEATSALDSETETAVMEAIEALQGKKTIIIIAHRLTTIKNCDMIYEVTDGKAIERSYEELIEGQNDSKNHDCM